MKQDRTRHIHVKSLFRADQFVAFKQACEESDVSHSRILSDLADYWMAWKKYLNSAQERECPEVAQNMAMFPAFRGGTPFPQLV
jgi:hypothetical protein